MVYAPQFMGYQEPQQQITTFNRARPGDNIDFKVWWPQYSKALYILSRTLFTHEPQKLHLFVSSLLHLVPNAQYRQYFYDFYMMKPYVLQTLLRETPNIFLAYSWLEQDLTLNPASFREQSFYNHSQLFFIWVYLLDAFFTAMSNQTRAIPLKMPSLNEQRNLYRPDEITKKDWGNSFWFVIHTSSLYCAPESLGEWVKMLYSLQWLLPCPVCREHLTKNIPFLHLERAQTAFDLFVAGWTLHNLVNQITHVNPISLEKAIATYWF
jgi:hypothetical protein